MSFAPIKEIKGTSVPVRGNDIDTDRIIPARFLKCVTFDGIGNYLFYDERFTSDGKSKNFPVDLPQYEGARILVSNKNFGCGSSREHAPQSIKRAGFDVVVAESFAEIFLGNSSTIGLCCVQATSDDITKLLEIIEKKPDTTIEIDLEKLLCSAGDHKFQLSMLESTRKSFVNGTYDSLVELMANKDKVTEVASRLPY